MEADLVDVKQLFSNMMKRVQPWILSHFIMWLDLKIAEYKVLGYMVLDKRSIYDKNPATLYNQTSRTNTSSPASASSSEHMYIIPTQEKCIKQNGSSTNDDTEHFIDPSNKQESLNTPGVFVSERTNIALKCVKLKSQNVEIDRQLSVSGRQESCQNKSNEKGIQNQRKQRKPGNFLHSIVNNLKQSCIKNPLVGYSGPNVCQIKNMENELPEREIQPDFAHTRYHLDKTKDVGISKEKSENNGIIVQNSQEITSLPKIKQKLQTEDLQDDMIIPAGTRTKTEISASQESAVFDEDNTPLYKSQQFSSLISLSRSRGRRRRSSNDEITYPLISTKDNDISQTYDEEPKSQSLADFYFSQNQLDEQFAVRRAKQNVCRVTAKNNDEKDDLMRNNLSEQNHQDITVKQEVVPSFRNENKSPRNHEIIGEKLSRQDESLIPRQIFDRHNHSSMSTSDDGVIAHQNREAFVVKSEPNNDDEYCCPSTTGNYDNHSFSSEGDTSSNHDISTHYEYNGDDTTEDSYMLSNSEIYGEDNIDLLQGIAGMDQHESKIMRPRSNKKRQLHCLSNQVPRDPSSGKFVCELCGGTFTNRSSYFRHKRIHGEKKFRCFLCDKAFHRKEHLQSHIHRHTKSFPLKCCKCSFESHSLDEATAHFQVSHSHHVKDSKS
ncbi:early growth response factor homolog 1-like [Mytilus trossulus]|uniref:early growth response factor homolog 1-like n=1 Tax=Mytilus trossulus TaxID=6551 RepID=UPI0030063E76